MHTRGSRSRRLRLLLLFALLSGIGAALPGPVRAQSAELVKSQQAFETAKTAGRVDEALNHAREAIALTERSGDTPGLIDLLRSVGEYCAGAGRDAPAREYLERALALQEHAIGDANPDLLPVLGDLADLAIRNKRYADAEPLEQRILGIERATYGARHENTLATLGKLKDIYAATGDQAAFARVEAQLKTPPATTRGGLPVPGAAAKNHRYSQAQGFATVRVFYGTNRAATGDRRPAACYGKGRGELQYGFLDVTIPAVHKEAELETQPRWSEYIIDAAEARARYVLLDRVVPLARDEFARSLQKQVQASPSKDVFVFVHGFNNTFEDAARRAAQLAYDLDFDGTPVLYSWPSEGSTTAYWADEASVGISGRKLADFLEIIVTQSGAEHVHLLAHSMGNRALIEALQAFLARRAPDQRRHLFGQIVFTAPDVDRDYFVDAIGPLSIAAERVTLYASRNDYALRSSQLLHGAPRAGSAGDQIIRLAGLDSIDMSAVPADLLGHAYFAANAGAIFDIFRLLWRGDPPPQRCGMSGRTASGAPAVYEFNADVCKGDDLLEAGVMLKRFGDLAREHVLTTIAGLTDPTQKQEWTLILNRLDTLIGPVPGPGPGPGGAK